MSNLSGRIISTLFVFISVTTIFFLTLDLGRIARLVPLKMVIPTLLFVFLQMVFELLPGLARKFSRFEKLRFVKAEQLRERTHISSEAAATGNTGTKRELRIFAWILALLVLMYIFGLLTAIPLFMFLYLRWNSGEILKFTILMTTCTWVFIYGVFVFALNAYFYEGFLWGQLISWTDVR